MKVSFIIPVYNCDQYLDKIVHEIENVKLEDYEVILIDDGSTDNSGKICDELAKANDKILCLHQKNKGVSAARNKGLKESSGDYVCLFDADDDIDSEQFYRLVKKLEETDTVDMAIFGLAFDYYYNGKLYRRDELSTPLRGIIENDTWIHRIYDLYNANAISPIWNKIYRRDFLLEHDLYLCEDMILYEDIEFSIRCMAYCNKILFEPDIIYYYRQSEDEGNAGRRLKRIDHISELVIQIEASATVLKTRLGAELQDIANILISLYLVLAKEKIAVSNAKQIKQICDDFADWYQNRKIEVPSESQNYARLLLSRKVKQLILKREYIRIRHKIAVVLKNTRFYQKLRGNTKWI
ncbi:glycosyltransferase family 2 protein [Lacrimispora saccharolytica]|nr:glycosyltransferase family 2 protein [Lacrimispora saccharolytica]